VEDELLALLAADAADQADRRSAPGPEAGWLVAGRAPREDVRRMAESLP
jgi:hypothetical protein